MHAMQRDGLTRVINIYSKVCFVDGLLYKKTFVFLRTESEEECVRQQCG